MTPEIFRETAVPVCPFRQESNWEAPDELLANQRFGGVLPSCRSAVDDPYGSDSGSYPRLNPATLSSEEGSSRPASWHGAIVGCASRQHFATIRRRSEHSTVYFGGLLRDKIKEYYRVRVNKGFSGDAASNLLDRGRTRGLLRHDCTHISGSCVRDLLPLLAAARPVGFQHATPVASLAPNFITGAYRDSVILDAHCPTSQSFARSTYAPSAVMTTTRVPALMCGGTSVRTPLDSVAGL